MSKNTAERILIVAARLFAQRGFGGTSLRAICTAADANLNAVSYHFGGKHGLYVALIERLGDERLASARRILGKPAANLVELETCLVLFAEEMLAAFLADPEPLMLLFVEFQAGFPNCGQQAIAALTQQNEVLVGFLHAAQQSRLLRPTVDLDIVAGALLERLNNQVIYANTIGALYGTSIKEPEYRRHWTRQTIGLLLHGAGAPLRP